MRTRTQGTASVRTRPSTDDIGRMHVHRGLSLVQDVQGACYTKRTAQSRTWAERSTQGNVSIVRYQEV